MSKHVNTQKRAGTGAWRRPVAVVLSTLALIGGIDAIASASSSTSEGIVTVTAKSIASGASISAGKSAAYVVSGGSTTVPTDATRVLFSVAVTKHGAAGNLAGQPYLDPADASGDSISWTSTPSSLTGTMLEPVGVSNKVAFVNNSAGSVTVTIKIIGYSTSAGDAVRLDHVEGRLATDETVLNALPRLTVTTAVEGEAGETFLIINGANLAPGSTVYFHYSYNGTTYNYSAGTVAADGTLTHTTQAFCVINNYYATGTNVAGNAVASNQILANTGAGC
jgi:hypothetical protein